MADNGLEDMDLTEEEQQELTNEAPTNEAETNEAETNEPEDKLADEWKETAEPEEAVDDEYNQFKERWAKKNPDEIIEGLWNQNKARRQARIKEKDSKADLQNILDKIEESKKIRAEKLAQKKSDLESSYLADPVGSAKQFQLQQLEKERLAGDQSEEQKLVKWHTEELYRSRPEFKDHAENIVKWGVEKGFSEQELRGTYDHRQLALLYDNYMASTDNNQQAPSDFTRAKNINPPTSLSSVRGAKSGKNRSLKQRATEALEMSDEDFNNISDKELNNILQSLEGQ